VDQRMELIYPELAWTDVNCNSNCNSRTVFFVPLKITSLEDRRCARHGLAWEHFGGPCRFDGK
jgi:hypothetical protein